MALRVQWSNLIDAGEYLRVHDHLWWALSFAFEQREHRFRLHDGPVDGRRCVPGVPLLELAGPDDVWGQLALIVANATTRSRPRNFCRQDVTAR